MPKYSVKMQVVKTLKDPLTIKADNVEAAILKAVGIVSSWEGIDEAQAFDVQEMMS